MPYTSVVTAVPSTVSTGWAICVSAVTQDGCGEPDMIIIVDVWVASVIGPNGADDAVSRVFRGGSWYFTATGARSGARAWGDAAELRRSTLGLRVAMNVAR